MRLWKNPAKSQSSVVNDEFFDEMKAQIKKWDSEWDDLYVLVEKLDDSQKLEIFTKLWNMIHGNSDRMEARWQEVLKYAKEQVAQNETSTDQTTNPGNS